MPDDRYAVVLNANAGGVTPRLARAVCRIVPAHRVHLTRNRDDAREALRRCLDEDVRTIFTGGDGTIVDTINALAALHRPGRPLPAVAPLRLGTGNALAHWLRSGKPLDDLLRWQGGLVHRRIPVHMIEAEDTLFPFAGLGHDAAVLNDYIWLRERARGRWWERLARGVPGYLLAGYLKTVPNYLRRGKARVTVVNLGRPAFRIGPDGREAGAPIPSGDVLYEGTCTLLASATTPFYGYGMRMFPFATRRAGRFQLRVADLSALEAARVFPAVWRGTARHPGILDFYADRVRALFDDAMPYQLGGDARGYRREITFSLTEYPVHLVGQA